MQRDEEAEWHTVSTRTQGAALEGERTDLRVKRSRKLLYSFVETIISHLLSQRPQILPFLDESDYRG